MSRLEDPAIVVCSISGAVVSREQCPAIPYTPEEYAAEAKRAVDEGATMIHIHARTPEGVPSFEVEDFRAITEAITGAVDDVIVNYSTGAIGVPVPGGVITVLGKGRLLLSRLGRHLAERALEVGDAGDPAEECLDVVERGLLQELGPRLMRGVGQHHAEIFQEETVPER